jgi:hypothetical protein
MSPTKVAVMTTGPGRDHADGYGVEELAVPQPVVLVHDVGLQEGHDHETAPEDEAAGLEEKQEERKGLADRGSQGCSKRQRQRSGATFRRPGRETAGAVDFGAGANTKMPKRPAKPKSAVSSRWTIAVTAHATAANTQANVSRRSVFRPRFQHALRINVTTTGLTP